LFAGCRTADLNPPTPRADTGYVDFYTKTNMDLSWEIKRADEKSGEMRTLYSEFNPPAANILRLAAPAGTNHFSVWVKNEVTTGPQTVVVQVENSMVTPVHVILTPAGETAVESKVYAFRGSAKGYGRGTKIATQESLVFRISAVAGNPQTYQPKERTAYFSPEPK
jgi:hypothetical protein